MKSRFPPHGFVEVARRGRVLEITAAGPWNQELITSYRKISAPLMEQLVGEPWGVLLILKKQALLVPEAIDELSQSIAETQTLGRMATAICLDNVQAPELVRNTFSELYERAGVEYQFFPEPDAAMTWLVDQIESAEP